MYETKETGPKKEITHNLEYFRRKLNVCFTMCLASINLLDVATSREAFATDLGGENKEMVHAVVSSIELDDAARDYLARELNKTPIEITNLWEQSLLEEAIADENYLRSSENEVAAIERQQQSIKQRMQPSVGEMIEQMNRELAEAQRKAAEESKRETAQAQRKAAEESAAKIKAREDFVARVQSADILEVMTILKELAAKSDSAEAKINPKGTAEAANKITGAALGLFEMQGIALGRLLELGGSHK